MSLLSSARKCLSNQAKYAHLNAFIARPTELSILERAQAYDKARPRAPDHHVPGLLGSLVAIKDNICTAHLPTTAASRILEKFTSPYDATVVKRLCDVGAMVAGKTNMDEFGMGSHSTHSPFGAVKNATSSLGAQEYQGMMPGDRSAGGSSGGSAVAVATGQCNAALGTDTGGSVRLPAAYMGVVGFKPSYGLLSRWGVIAYANSLDTVGIMANDVAYTRSLFQLLNGYDPQDPTSLAPSTRARLGSAEDNLRKGLRIGVPLEYNISSLDPKVIETWVHTLVVLKQLGHTLHPVSLPATRHALSAYYVLAPAEASSNLAKYDGVRYGTRAEDIDGTPDSVLFAKTRGRGFGPEVQRRILLGAFSLSAQAIDNYFIQAQKVRRLIQHDFDNVFATHNPLLEPWDLASSTTKTGVDVLICPTAPTPAPLLSSIVTQDPINEYMNDIFTVPASLAGLPAVSVPISVPGQEWESRSASESEAEDMDRPQIIGIQVIGQYGDDHLVLDVAEQIEAVDR